MRPGNVRRTREGEGDHGCREQRDGAVAGRTEGPAEVVQPRANSVEDGYSREMEKPAIYRIGNLLRISHSGWQPWLTRCNPAVRYGDESGAPTDLRTSSSERRRTPIPGLAGNGLKPTTAQHVT